jgi:hypothetical protein
LESLDSGTGTSDLGRGISTVSTDCSVCSSLRVSSVILSFFSGLSVFSTGTNASMGHAHMDKSGTGHKPPAGSILSLSAGSHLSLSPGSSPGTANDFAAFQASELPRVSVPHPLPARRNVRSDGKLHRVDGSDRVGDCERFRCFPSTRNPSRHCPLPPPSAPTPSERNGTNNWPHVPRAQTHTDSGLYDRVWSGSIPKSRESWSRIYNAGPPD